MQNNLEFHFPAKITMNIDNQSTFHKSQAWWNVLAMPSLVKLRRGQKFKAILLRREILASVT